jgi:type II secretory pathway pseudopilin PulG
MDLVLNDKPVRRAYSRGPSRTSGFSLVETLVGMTILSVALIGLLPLFTTSIQQNTEGKQSTEASGHGRTQLENLMQVDFNNWMVTVVAGTERPLHLFWTEGDPAKTGDEEWVDADPTASWRMDSIVRQFGIQSVRDADLDGRMEVIVGIEDENGDGILDNPLSAGTASGFVHLKTLDVTLQKQASAVTIGEGLALDLRTYKAF